MGLNSEWDLMLFDRADGKKDIAFFVGAEAVALHVKQRLLYNFGEWFLNRRTGTPWQQTILANGVKAKYNIGVAEGIIKKMILDTPGVVHFVEPPVFDWDFSNGQQGRMLRIIKACVLIDCDNSRQSVDLELSA